jgi:hypothetical protein
MAQSVFPGNRGIGKVPAPQAAQVVHFGRVFPDIPQVLFFKATLINLTLISVALGASSFHYANTTLK